MHVGRESVVALREKYAEIKRLREAAPMTSADAARACMAALSRRFPGALRELDELPMQVIEHRLRVLDSVLAASDEAPEWVQLQVGYHGLMRVALRIKTLQSAAGPDRARAILEELARSYTPAADEPALASLDCETIAAILKPDGGRLNPWVFRRVGAEFGVDAVRVQRSLFLDRRAPPASEEGFEP